MVLVHNIRSVFNVGSIFRTSEGFGVNKIYLSGYTPSPNHGLPHVQEKIKKQLNKTALGTEEIVPSEYADDIEELIVKLRNDGFLIVGLEQDEDSIPLTTINTWILKQIQDNKKIALLIGEEVHGIENNLRGLCDVLAEIPMHGKKESFNVSVATGIALYELARGKTE